MTNKKANNNVILFDAMAEALLVSVPFLTYL